MAASDTWSVGEAARATEKVPSPDELARCVRKVGGQTRRRNNDQEAAMAKAPFPRPPGRCAGALPGDARLAMGRGWTGRSSSPAPRSPEGSVVR